MGTQTLAGAQACTCRPQWTDNPQPGSHSGPKTLPSSECVLSTASALGPGRVRGPWAGKPAATTRIAPMPVGPLLPKAHHIPH